MKNATLIIENKRKILLAGTMSTTILMDGAFRLRKISIYNFKTLRKVLLEKLTKVLNRNPKTKSN